MKLLTCLLTLLLGAGLDAGSVQAQATAAEKQALSKQLDKLMQNPQKPKQELHLTLTGCQAAQIIQDRDADVQMSKPLSLSFGNGNSGWAMKMDNGIFEMKMDFAWADVAPLTYQLATDDDQPKHYQINIRKSKEGSTTTFALPLFTTNEATVKDVARRLEMVRKGCGGK